MAHHGNNPYAPGGPNSPGRPYCGYCYGPYDGFPSNPDAPIDSECLPDDSDPCAQREVSSQECPNGVCDDRFADLPTSKRFSLFGIVGRCFYKFAPKLKGFVVNDDRGAQVTQRPCVAIPYLKNYQTDPSTNELLLDENGDPLEGPVPCVDSIVVSDECGCQNRVQGNPNRRQVMVWEDDCFSFEEYNEDVDNPLLDPKDVPIVETECPAPLHAVLIPATRQVYVNGVLETQTGYQIGGTYVTGIPLGVMEIWPGLLTAIPDQYMLCDGTELNRDEFPELFEALQYSWGGSGSTFRLPDMRGLIPKGVDNAAGRDTDADNRTALHTGGNTGDNVGSYQDDQMQCFDANYLRYHVQATVVVSGTHGNSRQVAQFSNQYIDTPIAFVDGGCGTPKFGDETRPKNIYVNYIIRTGCPPVVEL